MSEAVADALRKYRNAQSITDDNRERAIAQSKYLVHRVFMGYFLEAWLVVQNYFDEATFKNTWGRLQRIKFGKNYVSIGKRKEPITSTDDLRKFLEHDMRYSTDNLKPIDELDEALAQLKALDLDKRMNPAEVQKKAETLFDRGDIDSSSY